MMYIAFDIETAALEWDSFSESQKEYILRGTTTEEEQTRKKYEMSLSPMTSQIVCIGLLRMEWDGINEPVQHNRAAFSVDNSMENGKKTEKDLSTGDKCYLANERTTLETFWHILSKYDTAELISFNGRGFDCPFLMLRSAVNKIKPSRNLMNGTKFNYPNHTDLIDELTFYIPTQVGATRRFNFDFYTQAFGIKSPKSEGVDGSMVAAMFREGKIAEISEYCLRDINATWELYMVWRKFLSFK